MQRPGAEAIRIQIQPSKPKLEITIITNCQNTKENIWFTWWAAISQKVATQQPKPNYNNIRVFLYRGVRNSILILMIIRNTCRPNTIYTDGAGSSFITNLKVNYSEFK